MNLYKSYKFIKARRVKLNVTACFLFFFIEVFYKLKQVGLPWRYGVTLAVLFLLWIETILNNGIFRRNFRIMLLATIAKIFH